MANPEHVNIVRQGRDAIAEWRQQNPEARLDLAGANLSGAQLFEADLTRADLSGADLILANLTVAKLTEANLTDANPSAANITGVSLEGASLAGCDLGQAIGLATINHKGPSSIGVDTLIASFRGAGNKLTPDLETFFLGAGVPRELLAAVPGIVGAVEYYSCFISYGPPRLGFAQKLRDEL